MQFGPHDMPPPPVSAPPPPSHGPPRTDIAAMANPPNLLQGWRAVLTRPSVATLRVQLLAASWGRIWTGLIAAGCALSLFSLFTDLITGAAKTSIFAILWPPVLLIGAFFVDTGILWPIARAFGGTSAFMPSTYLLMLIFVPLVLIAAVLLSVPVVGILIAIAASIYGIYLTKQATVAAHGLTSGSAWLAVLIHAGVYMMLAFTLVYVFVLLVLAAIATLVP